jgi:hypothetical protein
LVYFARESRRASALLERCATTNDGERCLPVIVANGGRLSVLEPTALGFADQNLLTFESAATLDDGSYAVHVSARPANFGGHWVHAALVVRASGRVVASRRLLQPASAGAPTVVLGTWRRQPGLVYVSPTDNRTAWFYAATREGDSEPVALPTNTGNDVPLCAPGFVPGGFARSWLEAMPMVDVSAEIDTHAQLAIGDAGFCLRGVETARWPAHDGAARLRLAAAGSGVLEGEVTHDAVTRRLRCER